MIFKIILFYSLCIFITHAEIMSEIANGFRDQLVLKKAECDKKFKVGPYSVEAAIQDGVTDNSLNCFFDCVVQPDVISDEGKLKPDIFYKIIDSKYHHLVDSTVSECNSSVKKTDCGIGVALLRCAYFTFRDAVSKQS